MSVVAEREKIEVDSDAGAAPVWQVRVGTPLSRAAAIAALAIVVALALLPAIASRNLIQDLIFVCTMLTLAQLWNVLAGWGGLVSVGQQAFVGLGAYALFASVIMLQIDPVFAIVLAGLFAAGVAAVLGPLLFRLEGPYFAIGSWVAAEALRLVCAQFKSLGGGTGMSISPSDLSQMMGLRWAQLLFGLRPAAARDVLIYWIALLLAVAVTLGITAFVRSRMGLALAASRDNAAAARSVGVRTDRIRYLLWIVVAFATGMVGAVVYLQKARISPDAAFSVTDWTAYVIFIVVIGGVRTIEGPMIGVLTLWGLINYLAQYGSLYLIVLGTIAILVMLFMPKGVWGEIAQPQFVPQRFGKVRRVRWITAIAGSTETELQVGYRVGSLCIRIIVLLGFGTKSPRQIATISECRYRWLRVPATTFIITHSPSRSNRRDGFSFSEERKGPGDGPGPVTGGVTGSIESDGRTSALARASREGILWRSFS